MFSFSYNKWKERWTVTTSQSHTTLFEVGPCLIILRQNPFITSHWRF